MSTSDSGETILRPGSSQGGAEDAWNRAAQPAALPDLSEMTRLANEFFRSLPEGAPVASPPLEILSGLAGVTGAAPAFDTRIAQYGAPLPSFPGAFPGAIPAGLPAVAAPPSQTNLGQTGPQAGLPRLPSPPFTPYSAPEAARSLDGAAAQVSSSPFALPLPAFALPFPSFESAPSLIPDLPAYPTEEAAAAALNSATALYFLRDARALSAVEVAPEAALFVPPQTAPHPPSRSVPFPDLGIVRQQFDVASVREDFPILKERVNGSRLIWLDNAATTQKPQSVIDRMSYFYEKENSNIHRAAHELAARATDAYEDARATVARFLNAPSAKEIVFVRGATEAINLVAKSWGHRHIGKDDEIVISWIEHHANIVPWQMLAAERGARLRVAPVDDDGQILLDEFEKLLGPRTRLVSVTQVSNALGTVTPARKMVEMAHRYGALALVDGAQAVSHMRVDVQALNCDFYVFSGHKLFAPTGIGVLYGKPQALADSPPWQGGGNMIVDVTFEKTVYQPPPGRFEAGTGSIADAVGLGAAIKYLDRIGMENIERHEHDLMIYATRELLTIPGLRLIGTAKEKAGVLSFVLDGFRTEEVGAALNREGIAVRSGHHCAQPTLRRFGVESTVRPSLALYNGYDDIDALIAAVRKLKQA